MLGPDSPGTLSFLRCHTLTVLSHETLARRGDGLLGSDSTLYEMASPQMAYVCCSNVLTHSPYCQSHSLIMESSDAETMSISLSFVSAHTGLVCPYKMC